MFNIFKDQLISEGVITKEESNEMVKNFKKTLQDKLDYTRSEHPTVEFDFFKLNRCTSSIFKFSNGMELWC